MCSYHRHRGEFLQMLRRYLQRQNLAMLMPYQDHRDNAHRYPKNEDAHPNEPSLLHGLLYLGIDQNQDIHLEHIPSFVHLEQSSSFDAIQQGLHPFYPPSY